MVTNIGGLIYERNEDGRLLTIRGGDRLYVDARTLNRVVYDGGFVSVEQTELPGGFVRRVRSARQTWTEAYRWDEKGRLVEVDGVRMRYDDQGRITAAGDWFYAYSGALLTVIDTPRGVRHILRGNDGRALAYREGGRTIAINYLSRIQRANWNRDQTGRLVSVTDHDGNAILTYIWDQWHCLGAIAGEPGVPMSAVYSLDPTGTPVRVVTREGMRRVPRDAFGEALLDTTGVPGLFGGAIADGLVHLPFRRVDPRSGSFDLPDPLNGEKSDPRRAAGWKGPLSVELPPAGPYTVCRNNPVSLADPTGGISDLWWLIPSALTWSIQNTIGSLLGMWFNLEFSPLGWIVSAIVGARPFDVEWITANNFDCFGLRADGWMSRIQPVAWTYQFLVNEEEASFTALADARLFAPSAAFRPTLYGTMLLCDPADSDNLLIRGMRNPPNAATQLNATAITDWSRCGGDAVAAIPGSRIPIFPNGAIHFDTVPRGVHAQAADLIELEPQAVVQAGSSATFAALNAPQTGLNLAPNTSIVLSDTAGVVEVVKVISSAEASGATSIRVDSTLARLAAGNLRLEGLVETAGTDALTPVAGQTRLLEVTGSSNDYQPSVSVVTLARAGTVVHHGKIDALEAQLALDAAVPAGVGANFSVRTTTESGNFNGQLTATPTVFNVTTGAPAPGSGVLVGSGATAIPAIVQSVAAPAVIVDRDLSSLGGAGTNVPWKFLAPGAELGTRTDVPEAASQVTYAPVSPGQAPNSGFVFIQGAVAAVRRVTARNYDAIRMNQARPDALPDPYEVKRYRIAAPDVSNVTRLNVQTFTLSAAFPANTSALHLVPFPGATATAGTTLFTGATMNASNAEGTNNPGSPTTQVTVSEVVVLVPAAGNPVAAVIRRIRLRITLERSLPVGAENLEAARLAREPLTFTADRVDDRVLRVHAVSGTTRVDMPRFAPNDLLEVLFTDPAAAAARRYCRVEAVTGSTITYANDEDVVPAGSTAITVTRLVVQDPATGSARLGIQGIRISNTEIQFSVWDISHFPINRILAIVDGETIYAVRVGSANQAFVLELAIGGTPTGTVDIALPPFGNTFFTATFTVDGTTLNVNTPPGITPLAGMMIVVPYVNTASRGAGNLHSGNVRVPEDHDNVSLEINRRQSLEDHELTHTLQSARLGPLMLVVFPLWIFELITDFTAAGGPDFSPYTGGNLNNGVLTVPSPGGTTFEAGNRVQISQNRRAIFIELGSAANGGGFRLGDNARSDLSANGFINGPVQVRRSLGSGGSDFMEWFTNIAQILTIGGLLNLISVAGWGGVAAIITAIISAIRHAARSSVTVPIADDHLTVTLAEGQSLDGLREGGLVAVKSGDQIYIRAVASIQNRSITLGFAVPLSGNVELSVYSPGAALFGLRSYFPAAVADENRPARLTLLTTEGSPGFAVHDRIEVRSANGSAYRTLITLVDGDNIELERAALTRAGEPNEFLVGKIAEQDPTGWVDQWLLNEMNVGWMQYVHDPWGQILYRTQPSRDNVAGQIFARAARYLFGTQSWMCIFLGFFWNDNAYQRANPHRSSMEQEASRKSGDTYCPLGSLHSEVAAVGDVARYWLTVSGGTRDGAGNTPTDLIAFGLQDAPGVNIVQAPTLVLPGGTTFSVPGEFYNLTAGGAFNNIGPRGWIPCSARLERSAGIYVAFTRPPAGGGQYQITGQTITGIANSIDAQNNNAATLFFNRTPADVTVNASGGVAVSENMTLDFIPFQRTTFAVTPNGARVYRATAAGQGATFDVDDLQVTARGALVTDDAEISRFYTSGQFGPMHLPSDTHIAVRRFQMRIQDRVPLRATVDHTAAVVNNVRPGASGFILVPAPLAPAPIASSAGTTPQVTPSAAAIPAPVQAFLGDGGVLQAVFSADQPPETQTAVTITIRVGPDLPSSVPIQCQVTLDPHFTLDMVGGGPFQVTRGGAPVVLQSSDGTVIQPTSPAPAGVTFTPSNAQLTVSVDAGFSPNSLTIQVRDNAAANRQARRSLTVV
jgi:large repetitive protein